MLYDLTLTKWCISIKDLIDLRSCSNLIFISMNQFFYPYFQEDYLEDPLRLKPRIQQKNSVQFLRIRKFVTIVNERAFYLTK